MPDAEYEVMKAVWACEGIVCSAGVMEHLENKEWKIQTVLTLLSRLIERGYLTTEKRGKIRRYYPTVTEEEYLQFVTRNFVQRYHGGSSVSLVKNLPEEEQETLRKWMTENR